MPIRCASLGGVLAAEEEDLPGELLTDLAGEVGRAEPAVEAGDVGVGLLEPGVLAAGEREVAHDVQAVPAPGRPSRYDADHDLRHEPDQALHLEDVQPSGMARVDRVGRARRRRTCSRPCRGSAGRRRSRTPSRRPSARAVAGEQHAADVGDHAGVIERRVQLVDGVRAEGVAHLGPVERDPHGAARVDGAVVGDVGEVESRHGRASAAGSKISETPVRVGDSSWRAMMPVGSRRRDATRRRRGRDRTVALPCGAMPVDDLPASRDCPRSNRAPISPALIAELAELADGDIVVVTSKIVSKAEGRIVELDDITPSTFAEQWATRGTRIRVSSRSCCASRSGSCARSARC